jgi:crossover junction endodeoxyribonuclease RuvC
VIILGIDPGSSSLGYGAVERVGNTTWAFLGAGTISALEKADKCVRFVEIWKGLCEVFSEYGPDEVGVEAGFVKWGRPGSLTLAAARGMVYLAAGLNGLTTREYAPATVKKAATGSGKADKALVAKMVAYRLGMKREPEPDAADALAVAITRAMDRTNERRPR